ncbi:MAG: SnoaL-like domain-containing protein [Pyrinomonadaceae bacterium]|nr:SnoaL-like domain-containing protein [Pyrinomonadaceae bacterium]
MSDSKRLLQNWIDAFNAHDIEALVECYDEDAINFQVATGQPVIGIVKIREDFESFFAAFPDTYAKVENLIGDNDWAAWEWLGGGKFAGEFLGAKPTGQTYQLRGCGFFQYEDEKIILQRGYWDKETWFSQVGLDL